MNVTKEVFPALVGDVCEFIRTCDFYAIDTELTGIQVPGLQNTVIDTPERAAMLSATAATRYSLIQFGLCTFHRRGDGGAGSHTYEARPFNFFLFPSDHPAYLGGTYDRSLERDLIMSPGAIAFNRKHGMDFQQWIVNGVEYCNAVQEAKLLDLLDRDAEREAAKKKRASNRELTLQNMASEEERGYFLKCEAMARDFMAEPATPVVPGQPDPRPREMMLPPSKSHTSRDATQAYLEATYEPHLLVARRGRFPTRELTLIRLGAEEMAQLRERVGKIRDRRRLDFCGFREVFKAMVGSGKPIVGHNLLPDLFFMQTAFDRPIDLWSLNAMKRRIRENFPVIFDTKTIAMNEDNFPPTRFDNQLALEALYRNYAGAPLPGAPTLTIPLGFHAYDPRTLLKNRAVDTAHEAGFDALMTGTILLNLLHELRLLDAPTSEAAAGAGAAAAGAAESPLARARHLANRLNQHRGLYHLDLERQDAAREDGFVGGANDHYIPRYGALLFSYDATETAHHIASKLLSLGFPGMMGLEVYPGVALAVISKAAATAISAAFHKKTAKAEGAPPALLPADQIASLAAAAFAEAFGGTVAVEVFTPYHLRPRPSGSEGLPGCVAAPITTRPSAPPAYLTELPAELYKCLHQRAAQGERRSFHTGAAIARPWGVGGAPALSAQRVMRMIRRAL